MMFPIAPIARAVPRTEMVIMLCKVRIGYVMLAYYRKDKVRMGYFMLLY